MARNGRPDEWSCPLCTLLNAWRDRRCAACDNERPASLEASAVASPSPDAPEETAAADSPKRSQQQQQQSFVYREASGVFFSSAPPSTGSIASWRQEPRLQVNRQRRNASASALEPVANPSKTSATLPVPSPWTLDQHHPHHAELVAGDRGLTGGNGVASFALADSDDMDEDVDVPCFNLLGPGMGMFPASAGDPPVLGGGTTNNEPTSNHFVDALQGDRYSTEAQHTEARGVDYSNGFAPASLVVIQEDRAVEEKLASAGLDLSDSDDDDGRESNRLRRTRRPLSPVREEEQEQGASGPSWECPVCTNFNGSHLSSCELCDTPKAQDNECSICSKILGPSATRCDRCGTPRDQGNDLIDLASSPEGKRSAAPDRHDNNYDSDFENPYAPAPINGEDDYPQYLGETRGGYDSIEEISDNEATPAFSRPTNLRPDLKDFDHFVCVEDLRGDYGCKVDYRSMFTGGRTGKTYADRLGARRRESQKRKRAAAKKEDQAAAGSGPTKPPRQTKPKAAKKGKSPARRRASTGTKRQRKGGTEDRRSSAPTSSSSVNYYDSSSLDFGEDVRTMAWEGVGSASYY